MDNIYKGQDYRLTLDTGINLTGATVTKILYTKPNGVKGEWTSNISGSTIFYDVTPVQNDIDGDWTFQSYVEIGGKTYFGETVIKTILKNIKS